MVTREKVVELYELNEADVVCLTQLIMTISSMGFSRKLTIKLMKIIVFIIEEMDD